jgi:phosphoribosylformylglycinamidine (FGAM) synthase-like enzyme
MSNIHTGSDENNLEHPQPETTGVFKSGDPTVQRLNAGANSAVSDVAVARAAEDSFQKSELIPAVSESIPERSSVDEGSTAVVSATETLQNLEATVAKVDALVQSVEQRQTQIEDAHNKAEAMLAEVNRIAEALTFSNSLRERIDATVARTKRLRGNGGNRLG